MTDAELDAAKAQAHAIVVAVSARWDQVAQIYQLGGKTQTSPASLLLVSVKTLATLVEQLCDEVKAHKAKIK